VFKTPSFENKNYFHDQKQFGRELICGLVNPFGHFYLVLCYKILYLDFGWYWQISSML